MFRPFSNIVVLIFLWRFGLKNPKTYWSPTDISYFPLSRLSDRRERLGSGGRHGWTKMDTSRLKGKNRGIWGTNQNKMVLTNLVHIVVGHARGTWDRKNQKHIEKSKKPTSQQVLGRQIDFLRKKQEKTKQNALARSIDLKCRWTHFHWRINWFQGIGKTSVFITRY